MSPRLLSPPERVAAAVLGVAVFIPPFLARLDGSERWMLDWFGLSAALLLVAATGLRRHAAAGSDAAEAESAGKKEVPVAYRVAVWIARTGAGLLAAVVLLQTVAATAARRWDSLAAPLVLLALAALFAAVHGADLLLKEPDGATRGSGKRLARRG